jgi:hypothetical protein
MSVPKMSSSLPEPISSSLAATSKQSIPVLPGMDTDGPAAWHGEEMAGDSWSDGYSYVDSDFTADKGINPIMRNWEGLGGGNVGGGVGGSMNGPGGRPTGGNGGGGGNGPPRSAKEEKLMREFEAFSKSRDMEFSGPKRIG